MDDRITIEINDCEVEKVDSVKSLGVYIDKHLNWSIHIENISKKTASAIDRSRLCLIDRQNNGQFSQCDTECPINKLKFIRSSSCHRFFCKLPLECLITGPTLANF